METVFITIHDLSPEARIKYCSESVEYIIGFLPEEVKGKSCWDYFHPAEIPFAKLIHDQGLGLDRAAVFNYCRLKHKNGSWVGCECVFTVVYDVLIASTAIYQRGPKAQRRANDGAQIRRIFSSSPRDARYQMLSYISKKFYQEPQSHIREPRAALFLNRFTRTAAIMFATNGVSEILGVQPCQLVGKSFYYCIAQNCLDEAIRCLESAKENDSIAYLRFWFRNPTRAQDQSYSRDHALVDGASEDEDESGGVPVPSTGYSVPSPQLKSPQAIKDHEKDLSVEKQPSRLPQSPRPEVADRQDRHLRASTGGSQSESNSRSPSDDSAQEAADTIFEPPALQHHGSTASTTPDDDGMPPVELEAVVSCTSDGLVVVLRRAQALVPHDPTSADKPFYANGLFASPWATEPVLPDGVQKDDITKAEAEATEDNVADPTFMTSIRDVAVFAWSLTSINGSLVDHARGTPTGEALPADGLPIWDPTAQVDEQDNNRWNGFANSTHRRIENIKPPVGNDTTVEMQEPDRDSSEDEILWKRVPQQPPWKRPKRKVDLETFGPESENDRDGEDHENHRRSNKARKTNGSND